MDRAKYADHDLKSMPVDELWSLYQQINSALVRKIPAEMARLDQRLHELGPHEADRTKKPSNRRRPYPPVLPKFRNPAAPFETWAGRGKQPRWLTAKLRSGKKLDDFRIKTSSGHGRKRGQIAHASA